MEYLPYGETLVDEHLNSYNSPFKFNGKELDDETGNYYYGARYYNPKWSVWLSVDPLARYNPVMEFEFYGDGQHNGGDFNNGNLNVYGYCYKNPIIYVDPNGKQIYFSNTGAYLGTGSRSNNVRVMQTHSFMTPETFDADYAYNNSTTLSSFNYNYKQNVEMLNNVGSYFQEQVGLDNCGTIQGGRDDGSLMFVSGDNPEINISINSGGGISQLLDDSYNFMNTIVHEDGHRRDNPLTNFKHTDNYLTQSKHDTWFNASDDFRIRMSKNAADLLNESIRDGVPLDKIKNRVNEFNNVPFGMQLNFDEKTNLVHPVKVETLPQINLKGKGN